METTMTVATVSIKPVTADQLPLLLELSRSTFEAAFAHLNNPEDFEQYVRNAFTMKKTQQEWSNPYSSFFMAWIDKQAVGYLKINTHEAQTEFKGEESLEIERIYVLPGMQQHGIGAHLLQFAERTAQQSGKQWIWLGVWEKNEKAIRFYQRHGFEKIGEHDFVIGSDVQKDWVMKKTL